MVDVPVGGCIGLAIEVHVVDGHVLDVHRQGEHRLHSVSDANRDSGRRAGQGDALAVDVVFNDYIRIRTQPRCNLGA